MMYESNHKTELIELFKLQSQKRVNKSVSRKLNKANYLL